MVVVQVELMALLLVKMVGPVACMVVVAVLLDIPVALLAAVATAQLGLFGARIELSHQLIQEIWLANGTLRIH